MSATILDEGAGGIWTAIAPAGVDLTPTKDAWDFDGLSGFRVDLQWCGNQVDDGGESGDGAVAASPCPGRLEQAI